jgi:hypothetical protein
MNKDLPPPDELLRHIDQMVRHIAACSNVDPLLPSYMRTWGKGEIIEYVRERFGERAAEAAWSMPVMIIH